MSDYTEHQGSVMVTPEGLRKLIGPRVDRIPPKSWNFYPLGYRVNILLDRVPETVGDAGLYLPDTVRAGAQMMMGLGLVFSCGPNVGVHPDRVPHPGGAVVKHPSEFLYQHVLFSQFAGQELQLLFHPDQKFDNLVIQLTDRDIWSVDVSPPEEWGSFS